MSDPDFRQTPLDENELATLHNVRRLPDTKLAARLPAWIKSHQRSIAAPATFKFKPGEPPKFPRWVTTTAVLPVVLKIPLAGAVSTAAYIAEFERLNCLASSTAASTQLPEQKIMATNLTKAKTKKVVGVKAPAPASAAEVSAIVASATKPSILADVVTALTAAVGQAAAASVAVPTKPAKQAKPEKAATPMHKFPVNIDMIGGELLLRNVMQAKALGTNHVVREQVVMSHDQYGVISLRMVEFDGGLLIGLIDTNKATYCECEPFGSEREASAAWADWLDAAAM